MEKPSTYLQVALASLVFLISGYLIGIFLLTLTGLISFTEYPDFESFFGTIPLTFGFGFLALLLMWWRNALGYIGGMVAGILFLVMGIMGTADALTGLTSVGMAFFTVPAVIFSLILIVTSYLAWRE